MVKDRKSCVNQGVKNALYPTNWKVHFLIKIHFETDSIIGFGKDEAQLLKTGDLQCESGRYLL